MRHHLTDPHAASAPAGVVIFNCALFRIFGSIDMGATLGWVDDYDAASVVATALHCRTKHGHAFTSAYCLPHYNSEISSVEAAEKAYVKVSFDVRHGKRASTIHV